MPADSSLPQAPVPPREVAELGPPERTFVSREKWQRAMLGPYDDALLLGWIMTVGVGVILILTLVVLLSPVFPGWVPFAMLASAALFGLMGYAMFAQRQVGMPGDYTYLLCPAGLAYCEDGTWSAIRWNQAEAFRSKPMEILADDGRTIPLRRGLIGTKTMLTLVERRVVQQVYRRARAALDAGQSVSFGPLTVTPDGLIQDEDGELLPWSELESLMISFLVPDGVTAVAREEVDERIWVIAEGRRLWCALEWSSILTRTVLVKLVQELCPHVRPRHTFAPESFQD